MFTFLHDGLHKYLRTELFHFLIDGHQSDLCQPIQRRANLQGKSIWAK
jgi:hypothetical protein